MQRLMEIQYNRSDKKKIQGLEKKYPGWAVGGGVGRVWSKCVREVDNIEWQGSIQRSVQRRGRVEEADEMKGCLLICSLTRELKLISETRLCVCAHACICVCQWPVSLGCPPSCVKVMETHWAAGCVSVHAGVLASRSLRLSADWRNQTHKQTHQH